METIVKITWDKPKEQLWLNKDNIKYCLQKTCKNTKFDVECLDDLKKEIFLLNIIVLLLY